MLENGGSLVRWFICDTEHTCEQRTTLSLFAWIELCDSSKIKTFVVIHIMWHASQSHAYHALAHSHAQNWNANHTFPTDCQHLICWIPVFMVPVPVKHSNSHFNPANSNCTCEIRIELNRFSSQFEHEEGTFYDQNLPRLDANEDLDSFWSFNKAKLELVWFKLNILTRTIRTRTYSKMNNGQTTNTIRKAIFVE